MGATGRTQRSVKPANTDQHTVPDSYMRAWCDPGSSNGAFMWAFPKEGGPGGARSPKTSFVEEDFYTLLNPEGERDLSIEHALRDLEQAFVSVRDGALRARRSLNHLETLNVLEYMAAMTIRSKLFTGLHKKQWCAELAKMEELERAAPATKAVRTAVPGREESSMGIDEVRAMASLTAPINVATMVPTMTKVFQRMKFLVLETPSEPGFITSDAPCVWFDSVTQFFPPPHNSPDLRSETIEVRMPVSPRQMAILTWHIDAPAYLAINDVSLTELNRITRGYCEKAFIVSRNVSRPEWFKSTPG